MSLNSLFKFGQLNSLNGCDWVMFNNLCLTWHKLCTYEVDILEFYIWKVNITEYYNYRLFLSLGLLLLLRDSNMMLVMSFFVGRENVSSAWKHWKRMNTRNLPWYSESEQLFVTTLASESLAVRELGLSNSNALHAHLASGSLLHWGLSSPFHHTPARIPYLGWGWFIPYDPVFPFLPFCLRRENFFSSLDALGISLDLLPLRHQSAFPAIPLQSRPFASRNVPAGTKHSSPSKVLRD